MKKLLSLFLAFLMLLTVAPVAAEEAPAMAGGWNTAVTQEDFYAALSALDQLLPDGSSGVGVYVLASQLVNGTNYAVLCCDNTSWRIVYIHIPLEGEASIVREQVLVAAPDEPLCGGMGPYFGDVEDDEVYQAIDSAFDTLIGCTVDLYMIIGCQVVAGTNYLILCLMTPLTEEPVSAWKLATVYVDLDGNATLDAVEDLPLSLSE